MSEASQKAPERSAVSPRRSSQFGSRTNRDFSSGKLNSQKNKISTQRSLSKKANKYESNQSSLRPSHTVAVLDAAPILANEFDEPPFRATPEEKVPISTANYNLPGQTRNGSSMVAQSYTEKPRSRIAIIDQGQDSDSLDVDESATKSQ